MSRDHTIDMCIICFWELADNDILKSPQAEPLRPARSRRGTALMVARFHLLGRIRERDGMNDPDAKARVIEYRRQADLMRTAAEGAFDPEITAQYLALAAKWLKLAEQAGRGTYIDRTQLAPPRPKDDGLH